MNSVTSSYETGLVCCKTLESDKHVSVKTRVPLQSHVRNKEVVMLNANFSWDVLNDLLLNVCTIYSLVPCTSNSKWSKKFAVLHRQQLRQASQAECLNTLLQAYLTRML
jgi:hypothetical protein